MAKLINIGFGNVVNSQKIVAIVSPDAAVKELRRAEAMGLNDEQIRIANSIYKNNLTPQQRKGVKNKDNKIDYKKIIKKYKLE